MGKILAREENSPAAEENSRRRTVSFSSEEPYWRYFGMEILDHGPSAVDLSRMNAVGVVLFNHDVDKVVGKVIRAWVENNRGMAEIEFDSDADAEKIFGKVKTGTLKTTSVRYSVDAWEEVKAGAVSADGRFTGPCQIARKWTVLEISIVSVPADAAGPIQFTPVQAGILHGTPAVIISYKPLELTPPTKTKWLTLLPDLQAGCSLLNLNNHPIAVYYIGHGFSAAKSDEVRRLRICISKIHACKETLRLLLTYIEQSQPGNVKLEPSLLYLKKFLRLAEKEQYYGFDNQSFWELAYSIDEVLHREQWLELIDRVRGVVDLLERNLNFGEVKVVGNITYENCNGVMIAGNKNTVIDRIIIGDSQKELNDALQDFSEEAERLLKEFEANGKEITELKEQIKTFCDSVKEKNPKKKVCNALLSGIKATLKNASAIEKLGSLGIKIIELL